MKVWLDDKCEDLESDRATPAGWIGVKTADEAIALLETGNVEAINLDHDLGDENIVGNGYQVLQWLEDAVANRGFVPPAVIKVHSANQSAHDKMLLAVGSIQRYAERNAEDRQGGSDNGR